MLPRKNTMSAPTAAPVRVTAWGRNPLHALLPLTAGRLAMYLSQLGDLLNAGVTMHEAMDQLATYSFDWRLRRMSREIAAGASAGASFQEMLARYPQLVPPHVRGMLMVGERAGTLPAVCLEMTEELRQQQSTRWKYAIGQLYYGLFFLVALLVPGTPRLIRAEGADWGAYFSYLKTVVLPALAGFILLWNGTKFLAAIPGLTGLVQRLLYLLPGSRQLINRSAMIRFMSSLEGLLKAGLELPEAMALSAESTGNVVVSGRLQRAARDLRDGRDLREVLVRSRVVPGEVIETLMVAHRAGSYERSLQSLRAHWRQARTRTMFLMGCSSYGFMILLSAAAAIYVAYHGYSDYVNALLRITDEN